ncbi:MAG: suppressor of fused domain protein [Sandaracinaceae bacterium]
MRSRDEVYAELFGEVLSVAPDSDDAVPHIEVRRYGIAVDDAPVDVWVTFGMSDVAMEDDEGETLRRELIFYAAPGAFDYQYGLHAIAHLPFENDTFLDFDHAVQLLGHFFVPGGLELLAEDAGDTVALPNVFLTDTPVGEHQRISELLTMLGDPVELLWVLPMSLAERDFLRTRGPDAFLELLDERGHPFVFPEGGRVSYL